MAYFKPYVDASGFHYPTYDDIKQELVSEMKRIYGQDLYLENDSQDYQMISAFALKIYDTYQAIELDYNNRSVKTAIGTALDTLVKNSGITRKKASHSTVKLTVTGEPGTGIIGGLAKDPAGNTWALNDYYLIIPPSGSIQVGATCTKLGDITTNVNTITKIVNPTKGWISVTNPTIPAMGQPIETDEQLRRRHSISVANPSQTVIESTEGSIAAIPGVTRYRVYENDTSLTDSNGIPSHSICAVVEGGADKEIAQAIYLRKGPGCGTYGSSTVQLIPRSTVPINIKFSRPTVVDIDVQVKIKALNGYTNESEIAIIEQVRKYLSLLEIGQNVYISSVWSVVARAISNITFPTFSVLEIKLGSNTSGLAASDIPVGYNAVAKFKSCRVVK
jgi:baseplate J-like protein